MATESSPVFTPDSTRQALDAACSKAGLDPAGAELMRLGENALYRLASRPIVVRIARSMRSWDVAVKEVQVARWLESTGFGSASLSRPVDQPITAKGHPTTFWRWIEGHVATPQDVGLLGETLKRFHELEVPTSFQLPTSDILERVRPRVKSAPVSEADRATILRRVEQLEERVLNLKFPLPQTVIHGDAHIKNLMIAKGRPVLLDFENTSWGHPEWDLAMTATEYATAGWWTDSEYRDFCTAYGMDIMDWDGFPTLRATHEIKMTTWIMQNIDNSPEIKDEYEVRMKSIREGIKNKWKPF